MRRPVTVPPLILPRAHTGVRTATDAAMLAGVPTATVTGMATVTAAVTVTGTLTVTGLARGTVGTITVGTITAGMIERSMTFG